MKGRLGEGEVKVIIPDADCFKMELFVWKTFAI